MITRQETYRKTRLSKSDYLAGIQCPKQLWLRANEPNAGELETSDEQEALFEQGRKVGELARSYVPGGTLIDFPYYAVDEKLRATKDAVEEGAAIIYEAAFVSDKQFVAVDILERTADGFVLTEVKSSTKVKPEHLAELALQAYVLQQNGLSISKLQVMHINRECTYPNLENLFVTEDVHSVFQCRMISYNQSNTAFGRRADDLSASLLSERLGKRQNNKNEEHD